ncbi:hypothetical protein H5410_057504, partial [Solanum commersonii]
LLGESPNGHEFAQSSNVPSHEGENQVGNRKKHSVSRRTVPLYSATSPKVIELKDAESPGKRVMKLTKRWIIECIDDPDLLCRLIIERQYFLSSEYWKAFIYMKLEVVANTILTSCFWLARERGFKTKITESMVCGYWVVIGSARESKS